MAYCGIRNYVNDPKPWGSGNCSNDNDCNGIAGACNVKNVTGNCICPVGFGNPDCSYVRYDVRLPGGLNIGLSWIAAGAGDYIIGKLGIALAEMFLVIIGWLFLLLGRQMMINQRMHRIDAPHSTIAYIIGTLCFSTGVLMSVINGALILNCQVTDGSGYAMYNGG